MYDIWACVVCFKDWSPKCRDALKVNTHGCVYGDIREQLLPVFNVSQSYEALRRDIGQTHLNPQGAWCYRHDGFCPLPRIHFDLTGTPCIDHSPAGQGMGIEGALLELSTSAVNLKFVVLQ
jgi:hypothetical protein